MLLTLLLLPHTLLLGIPMFRITLLLKLYTTDDIVYTIDILSNTFCITYTLYEMLCRICDVMYIVYTIHDILTTMHYILYVLLWYHVQQQQQHQQQ